MAKERIVLLFFTIIVIILGLVSSVRIYGLNADKNNELRPIEEKVVYPTITRKEHPETSHDLEFVPYQIIWQMLTRIDRNRALVDLRRLTGEEQICIKTGCFTVINRLTGSQGLDWAQSYIYDLLVNLGYKVELNNWSRSGYADQNLIARKEGKKFPEEEVYFISHIDGIAKGIEVTPAADDNASSVVNGLELARILSDYDFERTLVLFFSSGEEQGYIGVDEYLEQLTDEELGRIKYAVNRDMTGYDGNGDTVMKLFHGGHPPSVALAQDLGNLVTAYQLDLAPIPVVGCP